MIKYSQTRWVRGVGSQWWRCEVHMRDGLYVIRLQAAVGAVGPSKQHNIIIEDDA